VQPPRISVLMPVWNGAAFLAAAVDSVLAQTFTDFELLVIDDGSTDRTPEILGAYADPRLRVLRLEHAGIVVALNHGLAQARAEWVARLDADDLSEPQRLERQWQAVSRQPKAVLCHSAVTFFGSETNPASPARLPRSRSFMALQLCRRCPITHSTVLFKKTAALTAGSYRREERHAEDFSLWGRLLEQGEFIALPEKLVRLRLHSQSVSRQNLEIQQTLTRKIGIRHCQMFLRLNETEAVRAHALLLAPPREHSWQDWWWFLTHCVSRLRWWSPETFCWLAWQTARQITRH